MKKIMYTSLIILIVICSLNTNNSFGQWVQVSDGIGTNATLAALEAKDNYIFAGTYSSQGYFGAYKSSNNGSNWSGTFSIERVVSFTVSGNYIFAGTQGRGVYRSSNDGMNWFYCGMNYNCVWALASYQQNIFAGTGDESNPRILYRSTNYGLNWDSVGGQFVWSLFINGGFIFAGSSNGVYRSADNGKNWSNIGLQGIDVYSVVGSTSHIFAGTEALGVYLSTNNGKNWVHTPLNDKTINSIVISGSNVFSGTNNGGVYFSPNNGSTWIPKNEGFGTDPSVYALLAANGYIFAGTQQRSVWRRALNDFVGLGGISSEMPNKFRLYHNYPNPFNPSTKIKFEIPKLSYTRLSVFDMLSREVAVLVNEQLKPGTHEVEWDASNFSSGVYFYRIIAGEFNGSKKMLLIK